MKNEVFQLKKSGNSIRKIAQILKISRNTVKGILRNTQFGLTGEIALPESRSWSESIPWEEVKRELTKRYVTVKQLSLEYAPEGIHYLRFWRELNRRLPKD